MSLPPPVPASGGIQEIKFVAQFGPSFAVSKPPFLPTSGYSLDDEFCAQFRVMQHLGKKVWILHQLDADTSGVVLMTTDRRQVKILQKAMQKTTSRKTYIALARGTPPRKSFTQNEPLKIIGDGLTRLQTVHPDGKPARTDFVVLKANEDTCVLGVRLRTGRTHQIRVHLDAAGLHLLGERRYRNPPDRGHDRHSLHAWHITLEPTQKVTACAPLPDDLRELYEEHGYDPDEIEALAADLPWLNPDRWG